MNRYRVLVIDDEPSIVEFVEIYLKKANFEVVTANNGIDGILKVETEKPDIILLDWMLPDINGPEVCQKVRMFSKVPIIMLTARGDDKDKVSGLEQGADDYIVKPFNPSELVARINAMLRRINLNSNIGERKDDGKIPFGDLVIDSNSRKIWKEGKLLDVTPREYDILKLFATHIGKSFSRDELRQEVWGHEFIETRSIDVHIRRLRDKIESDRDEPYHILTIWGVGYKANPELLER